MDLQPGSEALKIIITHLLDPDRFFFDRAARSLTVQHVLKEELPWEIDRGRLLGEGQTRERRSFESWNCLLERKDKTEPALPILSVKLDLPLNQIHVTRSILCHAWEGYAAEDNVILSREVKKSVTELVGTIDLNTHEEETRIREELATLIFQAVVGTSRLPLTSLESPLPAFSLGELGYSPSDLTGGREPGTGCARDPFPLLELVLGIGGNSLEQAKAIELLLRSSDSVPACVDALARGWHPQHKPAVISALRLMIDEVSLTPYTDFVAKFLRFLDELGKHQLLSAADSIDVESYILRQVVRHLTAYDLVTYHHRGANYPDALMLDAVLKNYLERVEESPQLFGDSTRNTEDDRRVKRIRRRAFRQAWLMRKLCVGLPVPDRPTSPGENQRVLSGFDRLPEEQIANPEKRTRRLFEDEPAIAMGPQARSIFHKGVADLEHPMELRELGMALFLDRPLGVFKEPGEPDRTPLLSYVAFSAAIAGRRLEVLAKDAEFPLPSGTVARAKASLAGPLSAIGLPLQSSMPARHTATVSLDDAVRVCADFQVLRTTRRSLQDFLNAFDFSPLSKWKTNDLAKPEHTRLLIRASSLGEAAANELLFLDEKLRTRLQVKIEPSGYILRSGVEYPAGGLVVQRLFLQEQPNGNLLECDVAPAGIRLAPKTD
jgi:hypothetical protein